VISFIRIYYRIIVTMLKKCVVLVILLALVTVHKCGGDGDGVFSSAIRPADAFPSFPSAVSTTNIAINVNS
jgi:hypothetical protein